ncbi:MAG: TolB protein [Clostridium sp.]|jgi:TolB protein
MNMDTLDTFGITGDRIGGSMSVKWAGDGTVIGGVYSGDSYLDSVTNKITVIDGLKGDRVYIVDKIKDNVYYNTNVDKTLMLLNMATKEKISLGLNHVNNVFPSPDLNQILVTQINDSKKTLILCDIDGGNKKIIAEGAGLSGVSWSPDQRRIAYNLKLDANGTMVSALYIYNIVTGKVTQIEVVHDNLTTYWSPSGEKLMYTEFDGTQFNSSIVSLKFTLQ